MKLLFFSFFLKQQLKFLCEEKTLHNRQHATLLVPQLGNFTLALVGVKQGCCSPYTHTDPGTTDLRCDCELGRVLAGGDRGGVAIWSPLARRGSHRSARLPLSLHLMPQASVDTTLAMCALAPMPQVSKCQTSEKRPNWALHTWPWKTSHSRVCVCVCVGVYVHVCVNV